MDLILIKKLLKKHINKKYARVLNQEKYYGNIEYKYKLCNLDEDKLHKLGAQMLFRLFEGDKKAIYNIGYHDNGFPEGILNDELIESFRNIQKIVRIIKADITSFKVFMGTEGFILNCFIEIDELDEDFTL